MVWETLWKYPQDRWQQSFSYASDPLVFSKAFLVNDLKINVLLEGVAMASEVAVASLNDLKIQLWFHCIRLSLT